MKQLTRQTPTTPHITAPRPSRSIRQALQHTPRTPANRPDAYDQFVSEASPEAKDAFYQKLAAVLLKKSA